MFVAIIPLVITRLNITMTDCYLHNIKIKQLGIMVVQRFLLEIIRCTKEVFKFTCLVLLREGAFDFCENVKYVPWLKKVRKKLL